MFEHANRVSRALEQKSKELKDPKLARQALSLWRALSGIYVQGASGRVRALVLPGSNGGAIGRSVFALTEVNVLLRPNVLANIETDVSALRDFRATVRAGGVPAPIVVF